MIYETITRASLQDWLSGKQIPTGPAPIWELEAPSATFVRILQGPSGGLRELFEYRFDSGALEMRFDRLPHFDTPQMADLSLTVASVVDERSYYRWEGLEEEELGAPSGFSRAVSDELWGSIGAVRPVGPGGRITIYGSQKRADISIRHRLTALGGVWRNPVEIVQVVNDLFGEETAPDLRLRGALGYFEAAKIDPQRYLRPAFVFLLDRPTAGNGPRWRVASVTAASTIKDFPLIAGLETAATGCP